MVKKPDMVMMDYNAVFGVNVDLNDLLGYCYWLIRNLDLKSLNDDAKKAVNGIKEMAIKHGAHEKGWNELLEGM